MTERVEPGVVPEELPSPSEELTRTPSPLSPPPPPPPPVYDGPKVPLKLRLLTVVDYITSCLIIAPLVITYWRSTWYLFDVYLIPSDPSSSAWASVGIGVAVHTLLSALQGVFKKNICKDNMAVWLVTSRLYAYIAGPAFISYWRGVWMVWDILTGVGKISAIASAAVGWGGLILLRSLLNALASPLVLSVDTSDNYFDCSTRFRTNPSKNKLLYILDTLLTTIIVCVLVISLWRGIWTVQDRLVYPADLARSAMVSVLLGYGCVVMALIFQYSAQSSSEAMGKDFPHIMRIALQDVLVTIAAVGVVSAWRGVWTYMDVWLGGRPSVDVLWTNHVICIILLLLLHVGKSTFSQGCMLDGQAAHFPVFYLRYFFRRRFYQDNGDVEDTSTRGDTN